MFTQACMVLCTVAIRRWKLLEDTSSRDCVSERRNCLTNTDSALNNTYEDAVLQPVINHFKNQRRKK